MMAGGVGRDIDADFEPPQNSVSALLRQYQKRIGSNLLLPVGLSVSLKPLVWVGENKPPHQLACFVWAIYKASQSCSANIRGREYSGIDTNPTTSSQLYVYKCLPLFGTRLIISHQGAQRRRTTDHVQLLSAAGSTGIASVDRRHPANSSGFRGHILLLATTCILPERQSLRVLGDY